MIDARRIHVRPLGAQAPAATAAIDAIFWETVATTPPTAEARAQFHDLWLGQYLRIDARHVFVAEDRSGTIVGYLVGCWDNPARSQRFDDLAYFKTFAAPCARFPAHLHINLTAASRGVGIGGRLIAAFAATTRDAGLPGLHVVTGAEARNVAFYGRAGFVEIARTTNANDRPIAFLGLDLALKPG